MKLRIRLLAHEELQIGETAVAMGTRTNEDSNLVLMRPGILEFEENGVWTPIQIIAPTGIKAGSA